MPLCFPAKIIVLDLLVNMNILCFISIKISFNNSYQIKMYGQLLDIFLDEANQAVTPSNFSTESAVNVKGGYL